TAFEEGSAYSDKGEYDKAIADYTKAIELKNDFIYPYRNRGVVKEKLNYNEEALNDYNAALKIDPTDIWANYYRDELYAKMGVPVKLDDAKADVTLYQIVNSVELLENENDKLTLIQNYKLRIEPIITKIRNYTSKINEIFGNEINEKLLAHYSNLKTADILTVKEGSKLRYSNAVFMNDPEEGKILIDCLNNLDGDSDAIKTAFYNVQREERTNFYLGSFLPVKDDHEDELLMWRTYGKDENRNEAAGCCLLIDFNFFDKSDGKHIAMSSDNDIGKNNIAHPLYKVIYYNKRTKKIEGDTEEVIAKQLKNLAKVLKELLERKDKVESENNKAIDKILYHSLSELRYFFKSADYYFENELRVIQFATHQDIVQIDKESNILPRRMFVESSKEIKPYLKKIILGPKVPHPERWMYLEEQMKRNGYPIELVQSNCQYQ
ncbi:MAG: tetratricopeptide repeat protein, partial [Bacteroidota bacterium]